MGRTSYRIEAHKFGVSNYITGISNPSQQIGEAQQIENNFKLVEQHCRELYLHEVRNEGFSSSLKRVLQSLN